MDNLAKRIEKLENILKINKKPMVLHIMCHAALEDGTIPTFPEPIEEWVTYKEALAEESGKQMQLFVLDPVEEFEARKRLKMPIENVKLLSEKQYFKDLQNREPAKS